LGKTEYIKNYLKEGFYVTFDGCYKLFFGKVKHIEVQNIKLNNLAKWHYINTDAPTYGRTATKRRKIRKSCHGNRLAKKNCS